MYVIKNKWIHHSWSLDVPDKPCHRSVPKNLHKYIDLYYIQNMCEYMYMY